MSKQGSDAAAAHRIQRIRHCVYKSAVDWERCGPSSFKRLVFLSPSCGPAEQEMSLTSKYDHSHHSLPEPLLELRSLKRLSVRFPSLACLQNGLSRLTALETLRVEGLQSTLIVEPGARTGTRLLPDCHAAERPPSSMTASCRRLWHPAEISDDGWRKLEACQAPRHSDGPFLGAGVGRMGALKSLTFRNCAWLGDIGPNRPPWCPALDGLTSLTELVFDHCPMLNTLPDAVWPMHPWHAYLFCCNADWLGSAPRCGLC